MTASTMLDRIAPMIEILLAATCTSSIGAPPWAAKFDYEAFVKEKGWQFAMESARQHKLIPQLVEFAKRQNWKIPSEVLSINEVLLQTNAIQFNTLEPVWSDIISRGLPLLLLKGAHLALDIYPQNLPRMMVDIDALIQLPDIQEIREIFKVHGFVEGSLDRNNLRIAPAKAEDTAFLLANHYELSPTCKLVRVPELSNFAGLIEKYLPVMPYIVVGGDVYVSVACDIHFNISTDIDVTDVWRNTRIICTRSGASLAVQNEATFLWFLCARTYHEIMELNSCTIRQFGDILALLSRVKSCVDWSEVRRIAEKYDLQPSLYYTLWHASRFVPESVPAELLLLFDPGANSVKRFHDWGDFMPKLLGTSYVSSLI